MKSKKAKGKNSFFLKIMLLLNIVFVIFLLLSYLASYISPETFWFIAFIGLAYPILLLTNIFFIIFWLIFKKKYALISTIFIISGYSFLFKLIQSSNKIDISQETNAFKVISFNVRNFDIYNLTKKYKYDLRNKNKIFSFLKKESPDIVCFQEYVHDTTGAFQTTDTLKKFLKAKNSYIYYTVNSRNLNFFGIATYSRFPIVNRGKIDFKTVSGNICIYTDLKINSDTVRVYNVHFESIRFKAEDYAFAENQAKKKNKKIDFQSNSERILARLKKAFIIRAPQTELVADHIKKCKYPVILCGDFNDTPTSYAYHNIASILNDAFIESGNGIGKTYAGIFPSFRIDYIMHSNNIMSYNFETVYEEMSDHFPIKCYLKIEKDNK